jgi:hypothetical protein
MVSTKKRDILHCIARAKQRISAIFSEKDIVLISKNVRKQAKNVTFVKRKSKRLSIHNVRYHGFEFNVYYSCVSHRIRTIIKVKNED